MSWLQPAFEMGLLAGVIVAKDPKVTPFSTAHTGLWRSDIVRSLLGLSSYGFSCRMVAKLSATTDTMLAPIAGTLLGVSTHCTYISQHCYTGLTLR